MAFVVIEPEELQRLITASVEDALRKSALQKAASSTQREDELLQAEQVAELLNISLSTLHTYKKQGTLPFHRIGRRVYFRKSEVLASLKKIN